LRIHIQRVSRAHVEINSEIVADIDAGLLLLTGFGHDDNADLLKRAAQRVLDLRLFADDAGRFQFSVRDTQSAILVVPQFTLYGRLDKGRRPDFTSAMAPGPAAELFHSFVDILRDQYSGRIQQGQFGADMQVSLVNDGPVTLLLEPA